MSESKVISAVLRDKQINHLLQADVDALLATHADVWEFIKEYYSENNVVPPTTIVIDKFPDFVLDSTVGATKHHLDELRKEHVDKQMRLAVRHAATLIQDGDPVRAMNELSSAIRELNKEVSLVKDVDAVDTDSALAHLKQLIDSQSRVHGVRTGLAGLDDCFPGGIRGGQLGILLAFPSIGKPTTLDTPVATPDGWVKKGDLSPGDHVIARNGKPTRVLATIDQGELDGYRVTFRDGTSVVVGPDHDWAVYSRDTYYGSRKCL